MYVLLFSLSLLSLCTPCFAYLDGGASSLLLQLIFGGAAGALVFLKLYFKKLLAFFKKK